MNQRLGFGCLIAVVYAVYMITTYPNSPDGLVLSGVIGALCALAGVLIGKQRAMTSAIEDQED